MLSVAVGLHAQTPPTTPNIGLYEPAHGSYNWDTWYNLNWTSLDALLAGTSSSALNYLAPYTGASSRRLNAKLADAISVLDFPGVDATGATDSTTGITAANAAATATGKTLYFPKGSYLISKSFTIDVAKTGWTCEAADFLVSATLTGYTTYGTNPYPYVIRFDSSSTYSGTPNLRENNRPALSGCRFVGGALGTPVNLTAFLLQGSGTSDSIFGIDYVSLDSFAEGFRFGDNVWCFTGTHLYMRSSGFVAPAGVSNSYERMSIRDSMFADAAAGVHLTAGGWHFINDSLDNDTVTIDGDVQFYCDHCHFENPGATVSQRYITMSTAQAMAVVTSSTIVLNALTGGGIINEAPFYVDATSVNKGLTFRDCMFPGLISTSQPETTDGDRVFVGGTGKVQISGYESWTTPATHFSYGIAAGANAIRNGDFELGTTAGWTTGGAGTFAATTLQHKGGSYSGVATAAAGQSVFASQKFPVIPGQWVNFTTWTMVAMTGTGTAAIAIQFLDSGSNQISQPFFGNFTNTSWAVFPGYAIAPPGAQYGQIQLQALSNGAGGTSTVYIDTVIVNPS